MKLSYPIGMRGEAVFYTLFTTTYNCAKAFMQVFASENPVMTEYDGEFYVEVDGYARDVVEMVETIEMYCDDKASLGYAILDTSEQDWAASLEFMNHKLVKVDEEAVVL